MSLPEPRKSTAPYFYKYSSPDHLEWLRDILMKHELYLPTLCELNDNNDGLPHLALPSAQDMAAYLCDNLHLYRPDLSAEEIPHEKEVIRYNVEAHGPAALMPLLVKILDRQLEGYKIYSMTKRYDRMNLFAPCTLRITQATVSNFRTQATSSVAPRTLRILRQRTWKFP